MYLDGFKSERLFIRPLSKRDIPVWTEFFFDESVFPYIGLDNSKDSCEHSKIWIERQLKRYQEGTYGLMAMVTIDRLELVGQCGLITMNTENERELEVGYHLIKRYRGKGYASEVTALFRDYVFVNNLADTFIAVINVNNRPSMRVAESAGLRREKETKCMNKPAFRYVMTRDEWLEMKETEN